MPSVIYSVVYCDAATADVHGCYHTDSEYEAQLMLHQLAEEYAAEQRYSQLEKADSQPLLKDSMRECGDRLCYVQGDSLAKQVLQTPLVPCGIFWESYRQDSPKLLRTYHLCKTKSWQREYFNFLEWASIHSVTVVTNGSEQERRAAIKACLGGAAATRAVEPQPEVSADHKLEEKPSPDQDDYRPIIIALTEREAEWTDICTHVEPYSDLAIDKILEEQESCGMSGHYPDDVVIIIEASTHNVLTNDMIMELCERCEDLQMSVIFSIPLNSKTKLSSRVLDNIHYIFSVHKSSDGDEGSDLFCPQQQTRERFETSAVYNWDSQQYRLESVAWQE